LSWFDTAILWIFKKSYFADARYIVFEAKIFFVKLRKTQKEEK
jgi:hypothetical protein